MLIHEEITKQILKAFFTVYNTLGYGFLEKVYHNAMLLELRKLGLTYDSERRITVFYDGCIVGEYIADIIVEEKVIVELKATTVIHDMHEVQLMNYLRATTFELGLLLNFGHEPGRRRKIFMNDKKRSLTSHL
jgi:GxxExxY protein